MKKNRWLPSLLLVGSLFLCSSCATIFTPGKQDITFSGQPDTRIYDQTKLVAHTNGEGIAVARVRKRLSDKTFVAKKEGYKSTPIVLDATFNPIAILNLLDPVAWLIDLLTQKACKWDNTAILFELEPLGRE